MQWKLQLTKLALAMCPENGSQERVFSILAGSDLRAVDGKNYSLSGRVRNKLPG